MKQDQRQKTLEKERIFQINSCKKIPPLHLNHYNIITKDEIITKKTKTRKQTIYIANETDVEEEKLCILCNYCACYLIIKSKKETSLALSLSLSLLSLLCVICATWSAHGKKIASKGALFTLFLLLCAFSLLDASAL